MRPELIFLAFPLIIGLSLTIFSGRLAAFTYRLQTKYYTERFWQKYFFWFGIVFMAFCSAIALLVLFSGQASDKQVPGATPTAEETGPQTACAKDDDCWCLYFDGTGFKPGRAASRCDLTAGRCVQCYYE